MIFRVFLTYRIAIICALLILLNLIPGHAESDANDEKPKDAFVKIFNATYRNGAEKWETGLNLKFHDEPLANDVRVGEGGLVREITYKQKDTVDVFRNQDFLKNPAPANNLPAAKLSTTFDAGSMTLLVVHGEITPNGEKLQIEPIREFPVNEESRRPGMARLLLANFRPGDPVFLSIGTMETFQLQHNEKREVFLPPGETEIFLIHRQNGKSDYKRQLAAFKFKADHNYTGLISPSSEVPTRPSLRISDSNQDWSGIRAPKKKDEE
jgi:hypothetical protein